jgi:hypothetical protein
MALVEGIDRFVLEAIEREGEQFLQGRHGPGRVDRGEAAAGA